MARIILPDAFPEQFQLLKDIKAKRDADGATSELIPFLTAQGIDLADLVLTGNDAQTQNQAHTTAVFQKENQRELRDLIFVPFTKGIRPLVQFLKALYKPNYRALGDWGVTVNATGKVVYPASFTTFADLIGTFVAKHLSYPAGTSPLQPYLTKHNMDLSVIPAQLTSAVNYNTATQQSERDAEDATEQRDLLWAPVFVTVRAIVDYLFKLYDPNTRGLGDYCITVDDSPRKPKLRKSKVKPTESITVNGVVIGGTFTNTGSTDLYLYKGKTTTGTQNIVSPGGKFGTIKGYSIITVVNPDTLETGAFTVLAVF